MVGASTLQFNGANVVTNAATIVLDGAGSAIRNASNSADALSGLASNTAAGSFTIRNGRNFNTASAFNNAGVVNVGNASAFFANGAFTNTAAAQLQLAGGSFTTATLSLANAGLVTGFGVVSPTIENTGSVLATGGLLRANRGVGGSTGSVTVAAGASLELGANSSAATLTHNGNLLALSNNNVTVFQDYSNAGFGVGNAFDRRAGVTGSGQILAAGSTQQTLSGALVQGGGTAAATLALPNIRVGLGGVTSSFAVNNVGSGGPSLRGALQNTGITNMALTGGGVTAQNWGALAQGSASPNFDITFNPSFGQALSGQTVQVVNNFDNVAGQALTITGKAFNLAAASAASPSPVVIGNQRVGGSLTQALTLENTAAVGDFSERLKAAISANGTAIAGGSFSLLAAGASSNALYVGVDTSSAGAKSGAALISLASDGTGTSGFGALGIGSQQVAVSGNVYAPAVAKLNTPVVNFGIVHVGDVMTSRGVSVTHDASPAGLNDTLLGTISGGNAPFASGGTLGAGLLAGATSTQSLQVGLNTSQAGVFADSARIHFASHNAEMVDLDLGIVNVGLQAQVNQYALVAFAKTGGLGSFSGGAASFVLDFGTLALGAGEQVAQLGVFNLANGGTADALRGQFDLGSAALKGSHFTFSGFDAFSGVAPGGSFGGLSVRFDGSVAGRVDQVVVLHSAGTNASGYDGALGDIVLHLHGNVAAVPEPGTYALMVGGLLTLWLARRRALSAAAMAKSLRQTT